MALVVATAAARAGRLGPARRWRMAAWSANGALLFLCRSGDLGLCRSLGGAAGFFLGLALSFLGGGLLGPAILFGAATLLGAGVLECTVLAAARFLERGKTGFLGFAEQLGLHFPAGRDVVLRRGLARGRRRRGGLRRGLRRLGGGRGRWLRRRRRFARAAQDAPLLDLDDDRVGAAVAEALLDLAGLDRALEAQRRPGAKLRFFGLVCHSIPSSNFLQPKRSPRRVRRLQDLDRGH